MAGTSITITLDSSALQNAFAALISRGDDMEPVFADIAELMLETTKARFEATTGPDDVPWESLLPDTIARKKKSADSILVESGTLLDQLVALADSSSATVGSNMIYAATHQFGDENRNIVARPFLGIDQNDVADITALLKSWFGQAF